MTLIDLLKKLDHAIDYYDQKYLVNCGGCCIVAYYVAKQLERRNISYECMFITEESQHSPEQIEFTLEEKAWGEFPTGEFTCNHYCLVVGNYILNYGYDTKYSKIISPYVNAHDLKNICKHGSWNDCYDTKHNNAIRRKINKIFKEYDNSRG